MLKRKQPLLRHIGAGARTEADYGSAGQFPPQPPIFLDPSGELTKVNVTVDGACNVIYILIWIAIFFLVLGLGIGGWILADIQNQRNDAQNLQLLTLNNSVTYLDFLNMYDAYNITTLVARFYPGIPDNITALNTTLTYWEEQLLIVQNLFQIIQADLLAIFYQLQALFAFQSFIYNESQVLNQSLANITTNLIALYNLTVFYNNSFLYTINGVGATVPSKNINISGVGGLTVYPSLTENATIVLDTCALQQQISEIDANFTAAVEQFIQDTVMSNITVDTINGQYPIAGNINLVAGDVFTNITAPLTPSNEVHVAFYGLSNINGEFGDANGNINIESTGATWLQINQTGPKQIQISAPAISNTFQNITGAFNVNTTATSSNSVTVFNNLTYAESLDDNSRISCEGVLLNNNLSTYVIWNDGDYINLTPTAVVRRCRYNTISTSPVYNLFEANATFLIEVTFYSVDGWYTTGTRDGNGFRVELRWCISSTFPPALCTTSSTMVELLLIEDYGPVNVCMGRPTTDNDAANLQNCRVTYGVTFLYATPATVASRYLAFSARNGGFSLTANALSYWGYSVNIKIMRVL